MEGQFHKNRAFGGTRFGYDGAAFLTSHPILVATFLCSSLSAMSSRQVLPNGNNEQQTMSKHIVLTLLALCVGIHGCGGGGGASSPSPLPLTSITVSPANPSLAIGDSLQLMATDGAGKAVNGTVVWRTQNANVVVVDASGTITAIGEGIARVTAAVGTVEGYTDAAVQAPIPAPSVSSVAIEPTSTVLEEGGAKQLTAVVRDANGDELFGRGIQWRIGDTRFAQVDPGGLVTGLRAGITTVDVLVEGKTASASVRVEANYAYELMFSRSMVGSAPELYTLDIRDPAAVPIAVFAPGLSALDATGSPDGTRIAFVVGDPVSSAIWIANRDGTGATRITFDPGAADQPAWSPDGTRIVFRQRPPGSGTSIWVMDTDGANAANLTASHGATSQSSPSWSPLTAAGYRIAYSHSENGNGHLWTMRDDGSDKLQVTSSTTAYDDHPVWSPDGASLVFERSGIAIFGDLYVVSAAGGAGGLLMQLAGPLAGPQFAPAWSPDGRLIAFTSSHEGAGYKIYTVWADGTRLARRTDEAFEHATPAWIQRL